VTERVVVALHSTVHQPFTATMSETIFSRIIAGAIPADIVYEDEDAIAVRDIAPQAPLHLLIIPRRPIPTLNDLTEADAALAGKLLLIAAQLAAREGLAERGYRTVINCNAEGGQTIFHLHIHLLGGRPLGWPPG